MKKNSNGFTLIEMVIVVALICILAAIIFFAVNPLKRINQSKDARVKSDIGQIGRAAVVYFISNQYYPSSVSDLVPGAYIKSELLTPSGSSYSVVNAPSTCSTATRDCTDIAIYTTLYDPVAPNNIWCWKSSTGIVLETNSGACVP